MTVALEEILKNHQSYHNLSMGGYGYLGQISWQSIHRLLRYITKNCQPHGSTRRKLLSREAIWRRKNKFSKRGNIKSERERVLLLQFMGNFWQILENEVGVARLLLCNKSYKFYFIVAFLKPMLNKHI